MAGLSCRSNASMTRMVFNTGATAENPTVIQDFGNCRKTGPLNRLFYIIWWIEGAGVKE